MGVMGEIGVMGGSERRSWQAGRESDRRKSGRDEQAGAQAGGSEAGGSEAGGSPGRREPGNQKQRLRHSGWELRRQ